MMKRDNACVLSRSPDLLVMNEGYRLAEENHDLSLAPMDADLLEVVQSDPRYVRNVLRFDDGSSFFVIEKRAP